MAGGFFTDKQGRVRPISGKKGSGGLAVAAGATALVVAAYSGGGAATTAGTSSIAEGISIRVSNGKQAARNGQQDRAWRQMRLRVKGQRPPQRSFDCVLHSFGQVREFFARTPCRSLTRALVPLEDEHGNTAVVSLAWVELRSASAANALDRLDYRQGTGDVAAPGQSALAARGVTFTGEHYRADVHRSLFVRAEAAPVTGGISPRLLDGMAEVAVLLPKP